MSATCCLTLSLVLILSCPLTAAAADQGNADIVRVREPSAGAQAFFGECPLGIPPPGTVCNESFVIFFRETDVQGGGSNAPSQAPLLIYAAHYTVTFGQNDVTITNLIDGLLSNPPVAIADKQHLSHAAVAAQITMSDGSTYSFQGSWEGFGDTTIYGNNGPVNYDSGNPRHYNDKCNTFNSNAHQAVRNAKMRGTVNGNPVESYPDDLAAQIFYGHFEFIDVSHGACG